MKTNRYLIGIGNPFRSDDRVGLLIAEALQEMQLPDLNIRMHSSDGAQLMPIFEAAEKLYLIDAINKLQPTPGKIHRLDLNDTQMPDVFYRSSSHLFCIAEAIEMARVLNTLPPVCIFFGIEGLNFSLGEELSLGVEQAVPLVLDQLTAELEAFVY